MKNQCTLGPWRALTNNYLGIWEVVNSERSRICSVQIKGRDTSGAPQRTPSLDRIATDNARLIAAAPELLAVVQAESALYDGMDASEFAPETAARIRAMRDVLDKVNGGAA